MNKMKIETVGIIALLALLIGCVGQKPEQNPRPLNRDARFDNAVLRATTDHADALWAGSSRS